MAKRAKAERKLRRNIRLSRAEVSNVVCLKTLCDTVAQIENARRNKVSIEKFEPRSQKKHNNELTILEMCQCGG